MTAGTSTEQGGRRGGWSQRMGAMGGVMEVPRWDAGISPRIAAADTSGVYCAGAAVQWECGQESWHMCSG